MGSTRVWINFPFWMHSSRPATYTLYSAQSTVQSLWLIWGTLMATYTSLGIVLKQSLSSVLGRKIENKGPKIVRVNSNSFKFFCVTLVTVCMLVKVQSQRSQEERRFHMEKLNKKCHWKKSFLLLRVYCILSSRWIRSEMHRLHISEGISSI